MAWQPPPPYAEKPPLVYPQSGTTVIVNQGPSKTVHKSNNSLFGGFMKSLDSVGRSVSGAIDSASKDLNRVVDSNWTGPILDIFCTNNVVQLISRSSGKSLQIVSDPQTGRLLVDGSGGQGQAAYNACWTVINEGSNVIRLHNNNNYLAIVNGDTLLINCPPGQPMGVETKLQLCTIGTQFVMLESVKDRGRHVGILPEGRLKAALATGREFHAHFGVKLIYSPYPHHQNRGK